MEWINVNNKMPEYDGQYLCVVHEIEECGAEYNRIKVMTQHMAIFVENHNQRVTHWMTLPELP
ncbi:DUF551 domain-containing protein [Gaetbulibacter sp. PBL-D1]|uniref:DUF551 domain-containing protein n=1 Tax=Gaetbulibacter sp. PBL-D1 TaxID=3422594 RepID=UPI003D2ED8FB